MSYYNMSSVVRFYFDFLSPYSYLAWTWLRSSDLNFQAVPIVLSQVIHHYETKGPAEIAPKRDYLWKHCMRTAIKRGVPFVMPAKLPFNSSFALRLVIASNGDKKIIDKLFRMAWEHGLDIEDTEELLKVPEFKALDSVASSREARRELKNNVAQAIENNVFGTPTFIVNGELFWGDDCQNDLYNFISGNDHLDKEKFDYFLDRFGRE